MALSLLRSRGPSASSPTAASPQRWGTLPALKAPQSPAGYLDASGGSPLARARAASHVIRIAVPGGTVRTRAASSKCLRPLSENISPMARTAPRQLDPLFCRSVSLSSGDFSVEEVTPDPSPTHANAMSASTNALALLASELAGFGSLAKLSEEVRASARS